MTPAQDAKEEILRSIRSALPTAGPDRQTASAAWNAIPRMYRQTSALQATERVAMLSERLRDYGAGVYPSTLPKIAEVIAGILQSRGKRRILLPAGIDPAWLPDGLTYVPDDQLSYEAIDACDGVITSAVLAIALTGTIALTHGGEAGAASGQGRRALTLIPDYHLCVVTTASVVETVPEAVRRLEPYRAQPITLISGPSATADIEMTRIQGVHGPRVLDVVVLD